MPNRFQPIISAAIIGVALTTALGLTACSGSAPTAQAGAQPTATAAPSAPAATTAPGPDSPPGATTPTAGSAPRPAGGSGATQTETVESATFTTPSKNIVCHVSADAARCDINDRTWKPPPAAKKCEVDRGNGVQVEGRGKGGMTCAGDSLFGATVEKTLAYGHALTAKQVTCASTQANVRCENSATHHGFTLSRTAYTLF
jgi:hypothetical protein